MDDKQPPTDLELLKSLSVQAPHQKAINSIKQVTQVRKITQQTLSPVIKKVEQHITFLIEQSRALRQQTSTLQQVQATNLQYKQQIETLKTKIGEARNQIVQLTQHQALKQKDNDKRFLQLQDSIQELTRQGKDKTQRIKKLTDLNEQQTQLFGLAKQGMASAIDILKQQVSQFYDKSIKITHNNNEKFTKVQTTQQQYHKRIELLEKQIKSIGSVAALYTSERTQMRGYLQQAIELGHQAIRRQQYQSDKKYHRIQNELTKSHVQKTVNQALTPQIRSFLPTLIQNIQLLKRLQKQIKQCAEDITASKQAQQQISQKLLRFQYSTKKSIQQKQIEIKKLSMQLQSKSSTLNQQLKTIYQKMQPKFQEIQAVIRKQKTDSDHMFETFIQKNRTKIYLAVLQCKPPEVQQEENRIKLKLSSFEQQMEQINKTANQRSDNVLNIGNTLEAKLQLFQNRITKAKSDLKVQNENMKKVIQTFNIKMQQSEHKNHQQSQVISKLLEMCLINTSLQIDDEYLQVPAGKYQQENAQSYISFHDGIIYEMTGENKRNQALYRKKKLNKEILKRSLLNEQSKLIDFITQKLKNWKWTDPKERPSQFFAQNILPTYQTMMSDKKALIQARKPYQDKMSNFRMPSMNRISQRKSKQSIGHGASTSRIEPMTSKHLSKGSIQQKKLNNTSIQAPRGVSLAERIQSLNHHSQMYTAMDFHKPNRIKLKKIDQQRESRENKEQITKNRYSLTKQTI